MQKKLVVWNISGLYQEEIQKEKPDGFQNSFEIPVVSVKEADGSWIPQEFWPKFYSKKK